jgi:antitoxin (DNA-binding transcriptional repressor) of toxin-antitoxin stability system
MHQVELKNACHQLEQLVEEALGGQEIVITRDHHPLVRMIAAEPQPRRQRQFGSARGIFEIKEGFDEPLEEFRDYR